MAAASASMGGDNGASGLAREASKGGEAVNRGDGKWIIVTADADGLGDDVIEDDNQRTPGRSSEGAPAEEDPQPTAAQGIALPSERRILLALPWGRGSQPGGHSATGTRQVLLAA